MGINGPVYACVTSKQCNMLCKVIEKKCRKSPTTKGSLRGAVSKIVRYIESHEDCMLSVSPLLFYKGYAYILNFPFFQYLLLYIADERPPRAGNI